MTLSPSVFLVSNAHLDPVWQWPWEEGAMEAVATFRTAVKLLDDFDSYIFVHNESLLYEWVEELDPALFKQITDYVKSGRWVVTGGWYLQPDCNIPSGESFVRQILTGQMYFGEKFGIRPRVGHNVDSFGHNGGLPQILKKSGQDYYLHFRPVPPELEIPSDVYRWQGVDGTQILAVRPTIGFYCSEPGHAPAKAESALAKAEETETPVICFWGIGNHGGGASYEDLTMLSELLQTRNGAIIHSHPEQFFIEAEKALADIPLMKGDIQRSFTGCYTSASRLKRANRYGEGLLAQAERFSAIAGLNCTEKLTSAWKDTLFNQFHDIICGSSSEEATQDAMNHYGRAFQTAREIRLKSCLAMVNGDRAPDGTIPLYVFNPHAFTFEGVVATDFMVDYRPDFQNHLPMQLTDADGRLIAFQEEAPSSHLPIDWRRKISFKASVEPMGWSRYDVKKCQAYPHFETGIQIEQDDQTLTVTGKKLQVRFSLKEGCVTGILSKSDDTSFEISSSGTCRLLVMNDPGDSWGENVWNYRDLAGVFGKASPEIIAKASGVHTVSDQPAVRVVQHGPVSTIIEAVVQFEHSWAVQQFVFYPDTSWFEVNNRIFWNETRRMLKFSLASSITNPDRFLVEVPYGAIERPMDGDEFPLQSWSFLSNAEKAIGLINNGQYGIDCKDSEMRLSLVRSPAYCHMQAPISTEKSTPFMDQGEHIIQLKIIAGTVEHCYQTMLQLAQTTNVPVHTMPYFPSGPEGAMHESHPSVSVGKGTVFLTAFKKAFDENGLIARFHETAGFKTEAVISVSGIREFTCSFGPYELRTFRINGSSVTECNLMEEPV